MWEMFFTPSLFAREEYLWLEVTLAVWLSLEFKNLYGKRHA